jgi:hypothetical protein
MVEELIEQKEEIFELNLDGQRGVSGIEFR